MGLKFGLVRLLSENGLYFPISTRKGVAYSYARVIITHNGSAALRFLDGSIGYLARNRHDQLEVVSLDKNVPWVPTREQLGVMSLEMKMPEEMTVFGGTHVVSEVFPHSTMRLLERRKGGSCPPGIVERRVSDSFDDVPPPLHKTNAERFESPQGLWNQVVADCLRKGNALT